jgi:DNA repair exonuclease SbcCD ATPase subunit
VALLIESNVQLNLFLKEWNIFDTKQKLLDINNKLEIIQFKLLKLSVANKRKQLADINVNIQWYEQQHNLETSISKWSSLLTVADSNHEHNLVISRTEKQYQVALLVESNVKLSNYLKDWDNIEHNKNVATRKVQFEHQQQTLIKEIRARNEDISRLQKNYDDLKEKISKIKNDIEKYREASTSSANIKKSISELDLKVQIYREYVELFKPNCIPSKLMLQKLASFSEQVNAIFSKYTRYKFDCHQSETNKLIFLATDMKNGCTLEPERLSGFESVILQLAINQSLLSISNTFLCEFLIVDESLDCIDQRRFVDNLPEIIEVVRQYYQSILLISHRDVPDNIVDKQLRINRHGTYSTINEMI